jgi:hypothetical protein
VPGAEVTKRVLQALGDAHPDDGDFAVTRVDIDRGWGGVVNVTTFAAFHPGDGGRALRDSVEQSLGAERFHVRLHDSGFALRA